MTDELDFSEVVSRVKDALGGASSSTGATFFPTETSNEIIQLVYEQNFLRGLLPAIPQSTRTINVPKINSSIDFHRQTAREARALEVIELVGLGGRENYYPRELSGGQQQRVAAARALVSRPDIVFADEPSGNLDSRSAAELLDFMRRAVKEFGQTIVMVTHDPVSASYADRIVFLEDGKIVDELHDPTPDAVLDRMRQFGA